MNFRTTLVLLALLVVVGAAVFFTSRDTGPKPDATSAADANKLVAVAAADVTKIVVAPAGGQRIVLERDPANKAEWRLAEPVAAPARVIEVDTLLRDLLDLRSRSQVEPGKKASIGLDPALYAVDLAAGGKTVHLDVGNKSLVGDNLYVQLAGRDKPDIVAAGRVVENLGRPASDYRLKQLVTVAGPQFTQLSVQQPGQPAIRLEKSGEEWRVTEPVQIPADTAAVTDLTTALSGLTAEEYASQQPGSPTASPAFFGLNNPQLTVTFATKAPDTRPGTQPATGPAAVTTVRFGRAEDIRQQRVYVAVTPPGTAADAAPVATVAVASLNSFKKSPLDLRDKRVIDVKPEVVSEITLTADRPATTQPTTKPAESKTLRLVRRKENLALGPSFAAGGPTSGPATAPATSPSTAPATKPAEPTSKWVIASDDNAPADDTQVNDLLAALSPLRAARYLEKAPATQPSPTYTLRVNTVGAGGASADSYEVQITDTGSGGLPFARRGDLTFEVDRAFLRKLEGDFKTKRPDPPAASPFPGGIPGGLPGGLPGGFPGD